VGQTTAAARQYDAFGNVVASFDVFKGPFGFAGNWGYQSDADSGLQLLGHRYYDPSTGRFLTRDPIKDGRNWYAYCENNPLKGVDPEGYWGWNFNMGGQLILGIYSVSVSIGATVNDEGLTVGAGFGHGWALGVYAGAGYGAAYDSDYSYYDPKPSHQSGYAVGIATSAITVEVTDDDGNPFNGGVDGGGAVIGPGAGVGIYREHREGGFLHLFEW
jgi:RHS repeat-associated protein